jgi:hypothetical protein
MIMNTEKHSCESCSMPIETGGVEKSPERRCPQGVSRKRRDTTG